MYQSRQTYITANIKMAELIKENPKLLLFLEHFNIDFTVSDKNVSQVCGENNIPEPLFLAFANLYNGFIPKQEDIANLRNISAIIFFLNNTHHFYKTEKYPEIKNHIKKLQEKAPNKEVELIEQFFKDYFDEVLEHLDYEDDIAFPYFLMLFEKKQISHDSSFSVKEYREHHTDIETKLADLKNLLLKHIHIPNVLSLKRKLLLSLFELEFDLRIHALIEEKILLPLIDKVEYNILNG